MAVLDNNTMPTIVVKYGGAAMQSESLRAEVMADAVALMRSGVRLVVVHGGGPELSDLQKRLGLETRFVDGLRYTDEATVEAALMALAGKINKGLVTRIQAAGGRAVGISGLDGGILLCKKKTEPDLGFVGDVVQVDSALLVVLLDAGFIPVVSTLGLGEDGQVYNVNADTAAGRIAAALGADKFVVLSDIPGVLRDKEDAASVIPVIEADEIEDLIASGVVAGGMIPKVRSAAEVVASGVAEVLIADGRVRHALARAAAGETAENTGTVIRR
ncbi:acetylglutamate kinase [Clostridia bacterium]|nr:acetylglutamate kinase [Clostridia bacterium]